MSDLVGDVLASRKRKAEPKSLDYYEKLLSGGSASSARKSKKRPEDNCTAKQALPHREASSRDRAGHREHSRNESDGHSSSHHRKRRSRSRERAGQHKRSRDLSPDRRHGSSRSERSSSRSHHRSPPSKHHHHHHHSDRTSDSAPASSSSRHHHRSSGASLLPPVKPTPSTSSKSNLPNMVCFSGESNPLSNLYPGLPVTIDDVTYSGGVLAYYYGQKLDDLDFTTHTVRVVKEAQPSRVLLTARSAETSSSSASTKAAEWRDKHGRDTMRKALEAKFVQNAGARRVLLDTKESVLVHTARDCGFWSVNMSQEDWTDYVSRKHLSRKDLMVIFRRGGHSNVGSNILGVLLMELREVLQERYGMKPEPATVNNDVC